MTEPTSDTVDPRVRRYGESQADETGTVDRGRWDVPFAQLPDWVALSGVSDRAKALYWLLAMHVNVTRDDGRVWPVKQTLADLMGINRVANIDRYLSELESVGAIDVVRQRHGGLRLHNRYVVHRRPPDGYAGPTTLQEFYASRRLRGD